MLTRLGVWDLPLIYDVSTLARPPQSHPRPVALSELASVCLSVCLFVGVVVVLLLFFLKGTRTNRQKKKKRQKNKNLLGKLIALNSVC